MEMNEYAADLEVKVRGMRLADWRDARSELVEELSRRDDMPALFEEFSDPHDITHCRLRTLLRRAYRKRFGNHANVAKAEITTHKDYGRF